MPNKYLITAVQMVSPRGDSSLTIRAGITESAELLAAQAAAAFYLEHPGLGFMPVAAVSVEVSIEALEHAVAALKGEIPIETAMPKRRGRRRRLPPGMIPAKQEPLSDEDQIAAENYLVEKAREKSAWGARHLPPPEPEPAP